MVETGKVCITTVVDAREAVLDKLLVAEEVEGKCVPLQRVVDHSILLCYGQDTVIVPILAEVLVVEKRLMLQKVLHIRTRRVETHQPQRWVIRHEVPVQDEHGEYA